MKNLFLILIILTLNNSASAGFFGDVFKELFGDVEKPPKSIYKPDEEYKQRVDNVRCKVEYTKLDLITGAEEEVKVTTQIYILGSYMVSLMTKAIRRLADKITYVVNDSKHNAIVNITEVSCKDRRPYLYLMQPIKNEYRWSEYKICEDELNEYLVYLLDDSSKKEYVDNSVEQYNVSKGYNVHKDRLIKDYKELDYEKYCKDYFDWDY